MYSNNQSMKDEMSGSFLLENPKRFIITVSNSKQTDDEIGLTDRQVKSRYNNIKAFVSNHLKIDD